VYFSNSEVAIGFILTKPWIFVVIICNNKTATKVATTINFSIKETNRSPSLLLKVGNYLSREECG